MSVNIFLVEEENKMDELKKFLEDYVRGIYYCTPEDGGERGLWHPFENWGKEEIKKQIDTDCFTLARFLTRNKDKAIELLAKYKPHEYVFDLASIYVEADSMDEARGIAYRRVAEHDVAIEIVNEDRLD